MQSHRRAIEFAQICTPLWGAGNNRKRSGSAPGQGVKMKEVKKTPAKKAAPKAAPAKKSVAKPAAPKAAVAKKPELSPEQRYKMVQDAAYFIAERHGFSGDSAYFWSLAEAEISSRLD